MAEFARSFMSKYGWTEGKGLGANEDGMSEPIKVQLKKDLTGVGYDNAKQFTNFWWEDAFKSAANNIHVENDADGVKIASKGLNKDKLTKPVSLHLSYKDFVQNGVIINGIEEKTVVDSSSSDEENTHVADDHLLKACGGRTAHKGARHGIKQSGKLSRLAQSEQLFLKKYKSSNINSLFEEQERSKKRKTSKKKTVKKHKKLNKNNDNQHKEV